MNKQAMVKGALMGLLAAGTLGAASGAMASGKMAHPKMTKCYGVNAAYKNDCQSPGHSCAGQDSKARDPQAFVAVPTGLCEKLAGGHTKPMKPAMMMKSDKS